MKFSTDTKYIALRVLETLAAYAVALFIVLRFLHTSDPEGFIYSSLAASITLFILFFLPRPITVKEDALIFRKKNSLEWITLPKSDISSVNIESGCFKKTVITTHKGHTYTLHPSDPEGLKKALLG